MLQNKTSREVEQAGEQALGVLYWCVSGSTLDFKRSARFSKNVVSSSSYIPPERLPPRTCDASRFHSRRVYLQVQVWLGHELDPRKWGWNIQKTSRDDIMKPHKMDNSAALDNLLKIIKCNCTGKCDKNTCSCRKHALLCTLACGQCKGITCTNVGEDSEPAELMDSTD